jgi:hypothetical protein
MAAKSDFEVAHCQPYNKDSLAATATLVAAGPILIYGWDAHANTAAISYLNFFNAATAGAVTPGTTVADFSVSTIASGKVSGFPAKPVFFDLGLVVCATNDPDSSTTATAMDVAIFYA